MEILVVFTILLIIVTAIYRFLSSARHTTSLVTAKGEAKEMAELVLKFLERDISTSVAYQKILDSGQVEITKTFKNNAKGWEMLVPHNTPEGELQNKKIAYIYSKEEKTLEREEASASRHLLCAKVDALEVVASGPLVTVDVTIAIIPPGSKVQQTHRQKMVVNIRQARDSNTDPRWRNPEDVDKRY